MDERVYNNLDTRLARIEEKLDAHIAESGNVMADIRVLQSEMRFVKCVAAGFGLTLIGLVVEAMWKFL